MPEVWDVQKMKLRMRAQKNIWEDRRSPLVGQVNELEKRTASDQKQVIALQSAVRAVESAGGSAAALKAQIIEIENRLWPDSEKLVELQKEWRILNEVCKWAEYADEGLHWLIFAQSNLQKYDKTGVWSPNYYVDRLELPTR